MSTSTNQPRAATGMRVFSIIWGGQMMSLIGSNLTRFALSLWIFGTTGSTIQLGLSVLFPELVILLLSPLAGALVDRWDRRLVMIVSDFGAGLSTLIIAGLFLVGKLEVWHIYMAMTASAVFATFQWPAYSAATTLLVPKQFFGRASGMVQLGEAVAQISAPALAGLLIGRIGMQGIILIDVCSFLFAVTTLLMVRFPKLPAHTSSETAKRSIAGDIAYGWTYIKTRPGLLGLLLFIAVVNFNLAMIQILITPLVLGFASEATLGVIMSVSGSGMLVGSLLMSFWGGPKQRILGVLGFGLIQGIVLLLGGLQPSAMLISGAAFILFFGFPILVGSSQAIWQSKVAPEVQGRVFAMRAAIASSCRPLAFLMSGALADLVFEPMLAPNGALAGSIGKVIGVGQGRGIGLMFMLLGVLTIIATVAGYLYPRVRRVEAELPDTIDNPGSAHAEFPPAAETGSSHLPLGSSAVGAE